MTTIRFHQGLNTIGGTVVEITAGEARCLFDFGLDGSKDIDPRVNDRAGHMVRDFLMTGRLPPISGLYDRRDLESLPLPAFGEAGPAPFVLVSHMHIDHMGALGMLAEDVDVYMTKDSLKLYRGLCEAGSALFRPHKRVFPLRPMEWEGRCGLKFRAIPVDHDVPGACGFEFMTPCGRVAYTGDLRLHGFRGGDTLRFAEAIHGVDVLITEGITSGFVNDFEAVTPSADASLVTNEQEAVEKVLSAAAAQRGLVIMNAYNRNIERLLALMDGFNRLGRTLVLEPETVRMMSRFAPKGTLYVYQPLAGHGETLQAERVTRRQIQRNPSTYVLQLSLGNLLEATEYPLESSLYVHADGVPLGDDDPSFRMLQDFLARLSIRYMPVRCGGHAAPEHLKYLLKVISPSTLVPLHSLAPEKIRLHGTCQVLPSPGECFRLESGALLPLNA